MNLKAKSLGENPPYFTNSALLEIAKKISLLVFDLDGVLTDGGLYFSPDAAMHKRFDVQDGLGFFLAREAGLKVAVITGQDSASAAARMRVLKIEDYYFGHIDKRDAMCDLVKKHNIPFEQFSFLGDDWIDLAPMSMVGLPAAVCNAQPEVKAAASLVTCAGGGHGAARELIRFVLHAQNKLEPLLQRYASSKF